MENLENQTARASYPLPQDLNANDYIARMWQLTNRYNRLILGSNFEYYLHLSGTNVTVRRIVNSEFREALGAGYIFDGTETDEEVKVYQKRIIINRSQMIRNYRSTVDDIEAMTNEDFYKIGDQIEFNFLDINFKYKITEIDQFEPYSNMLFKLTLSGFEEFKKT